MPKGRTRKDTIGNSGEQVARKSLCDLPTSALAEIFGYLGNDRVFDDETEPLCAQHISKALLPFTQRNLYRNADIHSADHLAKFCLALRSNPTLAGLVEDLKLQPWRSEGFEYPSESELQQLFGALVNIRKLMLHDAAANPIAKIVLSEAVASTSLPSLQILSIDGAF